jgi:hypothetical protein
MSVRISPNLPANVVEIGNEITQAKLDAINNGYAPTSGNPFTTVSYLTTNGYLTDAPSNGSQYARKDGAWAVVTGGSGSATWGGITGTLSAQTDLNTALGLKSPLASPTFTGTPAAPTASAGTNTTQLATTAFVTTADNLKSNIASPTFTGTPLAPTASTGTNSTQIATTAFVQSAIIAGTAHAETLQATVRNNTGATLNPFTVVYINGALGNNATVAKAQANAESTSAGTFAVTEASISNNADGTVISAGVLSNVNTSAYTDGDKLYLSPTTAGAVTTTKPSAPNHMVYVGVVTRSHPTLGTVSIRIQNGFELEELHNVAISSLVDGQVLAYDAANSVWKNTTSGGGGGGISEAPTDGFSYVRQMGNWLQVGASAYDTPTTQEWVTSQGYATTSYVTGLGYQTASDVSTALSSYLPLAGGAMASTASITLSDTTRDSYVGFDGFGVELTADTTQQSWQGYNEIYVKNAGSGVTLNTTGITFPDNSVQTTAATGSYNINKFYADTIASRIIQWYNYSGYFGTDMGSNPPLFVTNLGSAIQITDGSTDYTFSSYYAGSFYFSSSWSSGTFYVKVNGVQSSIPIPY